MPLNTLAHVSIRTKKLQETRDFYVDVLGLVDGDRPPFDFPGNWLYLGTEAVVHLIGIDPKRPSTTAAYLGERDIDNGKTTGAFDHAAFFATDFAGVRERMVKKGVKFFERQVPLVGLRQIFIHDPNGILVELNFPALEATDAKKPAAQKSAAKKREKAHAGAM
ncbi:MAG TPA: VOC family protein [Alphaproteobacteria bacterium]|nr:VOC family protein [Alphaproteobacteria bacterium]